MIKLHDDPTRTTSLGMARYGYEFIEAAFSVDADIGRKDGFEIISPIPVLYLLGHGIELSLKAYLLEHGSTLSELKALGHNLSRSFDKANEHDLHQLVSFEEGQLSAFKILDELYSTKQLEYIVTGAKQFPIFGPLQLFSVKLFNAVAGSVGFRKRFEGFRA